MAIKSCVPRTVSKQAAREIIDHLSDQVSWDDIMYELYVKQKIEEGLTDIEAACTIPHEQVKAADMYRGVGAVFAFEGGDHRFQHMDAAIEIIRDAYVSGISDSGLT